MPRPGVPPEKREAAIATYLQHGMDEATRQHGIHQTTLSRWLREAGRASEAPEKLRAANNMLRAQTEHGRAELAARFIEEAHRELDLLREQIHEKKIVTLAGTPTTPGTWEEASVVRDPSPAERKTMITSAAIAYDKASVQLGLATVRVGVEGRDDREVRETAARILRAVQGDAGRGSEGKGAA